MKAKISVSMDRKLLEEADKLIEQGVFRSTSHVVEYGLRKLLEEQQ